MWCCSEVLLWDRLLDFPPENFPVFYKNQNVIHVDYIVLDDTFSFIQNFIDEDMKKTYSNMKLMQDNSRTKQLKAVATEVLH